VDEDVEVRPQELAMAGSLIETLSGDFDPTAYTDRYREALLALIEAKVAGREVVAPRTSEQPGVVVDLMSALRASVEAAKADREPAAERGGTRHQPGTEQETERAEAPKSAPRKRAAPAKKATGTASGARKEPAARADAEDTAQTPAAKKAPAKRAAAKKEAAKRAKSA
jgi:DNA end-binding protein Ku